MKLIRKGTVFNIFKLLYILIIFASLLSLKITIDYYDGYLLRSEVDIMYMLESILYSVFILSGSIFLFCKYT